MAATDIVVDANVIVKWFVDEDGSEQARDILASSRTLVVPTHALAETGEVLTRYRRSGKVADAQLRQIASVLPDLVHSVPIESVFDVALDIAWITGASVYDALYLAAASHAGTVLVTSDERLLRLISATPWSASAVPLRSWAIDAGS